MFKTAAATFFEEQVSLGEFTSAIFYAVATSAIFLAVAGLVAFDIGIVRRKNVLDTAIQKITAAMISGFAFMIIGYGIWNWQYYNAFGIPDPLWASIKDWWLGGAQLRSVAQFIDPAHTPHAETFQVFAAFNFGAAAIMGGFLHSIGVERMKAKALYILAAILGGIVFPFAIYLTWGSLSPLTNAGVHDFVGIFPFYILIGTWAVILSWRLGPRIGAFRAGPTDETPLPGNWGMVAFGVMLILVSITLFAMGAGFVTPDLGFIGISMTTSGFGLTYTNIFMSFAGGTLMGALIAYRTGRAFFVLLGPLAGYVACSALFDIAKPWETALVSLGGPIAAYAVYRALQAREIDDPKIAPLTLGPGIYGALMAGIVGWGDGTGGYLGIEEGPFAFQHAEINLWWQMVGVAVIVVGGGAIAYLVIRLLERTVGLRVTAEQEIQGLDRSFWPDAVPAPAASESNGGGIPAGVGPGTPLVVTSPER